MLYWLVYYYALSRGPYCEVILTLLNSLTHTKNEVSCGES